MAKKIILTFNDPIEVGVAHEFNYDIYIDGVRIVYNYGNNNVNLHYRVNGTGNLIPNGIEKQLQINNTVLSTLNWLNTYYAHPLITYQKIENIIEVYINSESSIIQNLYSSNIGVVTAQEEINVIVEGEMKLKYFFEYKNLANDDYRFEIYQIGFTGSSKEITGRASIQKASSKDHLDPVRGTSVNIMLEASVDFTLQDLYSQNELDFPVKFYRNSKLIFRGFLNPDGVFQSFTRDIWQINLSCVDGLGAIDNLSFVKETGLRFIGKMNSQDIIFNCLRRTGMLQKINTSVNIFYEGYEDLPNKNIFESVVLNTDRFIKEDDDTIMSCGDVLRSILDIFNACITQEDGEWYIYRPNELFQNAYVDFKKYDISNIYTNTIKKNLNKTLGSQINNFYPHHCGGDQTIQIKGGISAFRINYKYGFDKGVLNNGSLFHTDDLDYPFWTVNPESLIGGGGSYITGSWIFNDPTTDYGVYARSSGVGSMLLLTSAPITVEAGYKFTFKATYISHSETDELTFFSKVKVGGYSLQNDGTWLLGDTFVSQSVIGERKYILNTEKIPVSGDLTIEIWSASNRYTVIDTPIMTTQKDFDIINTFDGNNIIGEFHTAQRGDGISSIVKENKKVYNGDNTGIAYVGAIYKLDTFTLTDLWYRKNFVESKPLLRIATEDSLRIFQKPLQLFNGSFFGYTPYLSILKIDGLEGVFMPIEYSYDTFTNQGSAKWLQLFSNELPDINYKFTYDYGETVKPTIIG